MTRRYAVPRTSPSVTIPTAPAPPKMFGPPFEPQAGLVTPSIGPWRGMTEKILLLLLVVTLATGLYLVSSPYENCKRTFAKEMRHNTGILILQYKQLCKDRMRW